MFRKIYSASRVLEYGSQDYLIRSVHTLITKRHNSSATVTLTQAVQQEWDSARPYEELPGPKPLPIVGNIWRFLPYIGTFPMEFLDLQINIRKKFGNIAKLAGLPGRNDLVFVYEPEDAEKVFRNDGPWPIRDSGQSLQYYRKVTRKDIFEGVGGAVVNHGEEWQSFRTKVNQPMMQPKSTKLYIAPIDAVATDFIKRIRNLRDEKDEMPEDFKNEFHKWALESIVYIALDTRVGCLSGELPPDSEPQKMIDAVQVIFDGMYELDVRFSFYKMISTPTWRKFVKASDYFTEVSMKYINQAMERLKSMPKDSDQELTILEKLLYRDQNPKTAIVMALDMMVAGVDTTSYATIIALYYLAKNPDKQHKLFEEIKTHLVDKDQPVTANILNELKYLKACVKESMRMKPIVLGNLRRLTKDLVLSNYRIPKGTDVGMCNLLMCQMEEHFPQADKFIPERWLRSEDGGQPESKMTHPFVFMPFGFGPRMCLGRRFAELELETLVTKIIRNFHLEYNYGEMKFESKLLYTPVSPLKFKFVDRK